MPHIRRVAIGPVLLLVLLLAGCGGEGEATSAAGPELAQGQALYEANCAACHGIEGEGQPNWRSPDENGQFPAPPHDESGHTWHHADAVLLGIIAEGGQMPNSAMPAFGDKLTQEEMEAILAYIKSFWPPEIRDAQSDMTRRAPQ